MVWKGRFSVKQTTQQDLEELVDDLESVPLRSRSFSKTDFSSNTVSKQALSTEVQLQLNTADRTAARAEGLAIRANNPIHMSGSIPASAANLTDDWSFKRLGMHVGSSITSSGSVSVGTATFYLVSTSGADVTVGLPAANTCTNMVLSFKKLLAANNMILDPDGSETIDGAATKSFSDRWTFVNIISNGTNWFILSSGVP
tara:strand:- start:18856 stop:19455 length:600 start_codon:yes stop_codon:yes gene_type:complete